MPDVKPQLIDDLQFLGSIFQEIDIGFNEADYGDDSAGSHWMPPAESTIRSKRHNRILFEEGHLAASLISVGGGGQIAATSHRGLKYGTENTKAGFHQTGTRQMPARLPVWRQDSRLDEIVEAVADRAVGSLRN